MDPDPKLYDHPDRTTLVWLPADGQPGAGSADAPKVTTIRKQVPVKKAATPRRAAARNTAHSRKRAAPARKAVTTQKAASQSQTVRKGV
jgi:hypothetical protein